MLKNFLIMIIVFSLNNLPAIELNTVYPNRKCDDVINEYGINNNLKTAKGWLRVCNNNKLSLYTDHIPKKNLYGILCECLSKDIDQRSLNFFYRKGE
jgi:hypothetical protein